MSSAKLTPPSQRRPLTTCPSYFSCRSHPNHRRPFQAAEIHPQHEISRHENRTDHSFNFTPKPPSSLSRSLGVPTLTHAETTWPSLRHVRAALKTCTDLTINADLTRGLHPGVQFLLPTPYTYTSTPPTRPSQIPFIYSSLYHVLPTLIGLDTRASVDYDSGIHTRLGLSVLS